jgi:hypothetical protein
VAIKQRVATARAFLKFLILQTLSLLKISGPYGAYSAFLKQILTGNASKKCDDLHRLETHLATVPLSLLCLAFILDPVEDGGEAEHPGNPQTT